MANTRILIWSSQSVCRKYLELLHLHVQQHNVDILLLNENHLFQVCGLKLSNFHSYYTNTPPFVGLFPSAVNVNICIIHYPVKIPKIFLTNNAIHIRISSSDMWLVAVYKSPNAPLITSDLNALLSSHIDIIFAGDLNAKTPSWNSHTFNTSGCNLQHYLDQRQDTSVATSSSATYYPNNSNHCLDIFISFFSKPAN